MEIRIDAPFEEAADLFGELAEKVYPRVELSALNEAAEKNRNQIRAGITKRTGVPSKTLNKRMKLHRARRVSGAGAGGHTSARIFIGTMPVSIYHHLNPTELKRGGVSYRGPSGRLKLPKAFIAKTVHGHGVFQRTTKKRFPLKFQAVPIGDAARQAANEALRDFREDYLKRFASKFQFRMGEAIAKRRKIRLL